jgi:hypothetical protein
MAVSRQSEMDVHRENIGTRADLSVCQETRRTRMVRRSGLLSLSLSARLGANGDGPNYTCGM